MRSIQAHQRALRAAVYEELTVGAAAVGFQQLPAGLIKTEFIVRSGPVMLTADGSTPTSGFGEDAFDGDRFELSAHEASRLLAIRQGVTNGVLKAHHFVAV